VSRDPMECPELAGKTIRLVRMYENAEDGCETLIEFTDGTSFSCSACHRPVVRATLYKAGVGNPEIIRDYGF
jgi:hypothetical protein